MKPEELLDFVKACSKHWLRPVSMLVAFKVDYRNNGIEVRAYYKGCSYNILIPFIEIENLEIKHIRKKYLVYSDHLCILVQKQEKFQKL